MKFLSRGRVCVYAYVIQLFYWMFLSKRISLCCKKNKQYRSVFKINYLLLSFVNPTLPKLSMETYWCLIFHSRPWSSMVSKIVSWTESCIKRRLFQYNFYNVKHMNPSEILSLALGAISPSPGDPMPGSLSLVTGLPA